jgi:hypothetical protein
LSPQVVGLIERTTFLTLGAAPNCFRSQQSPLASLLLPSVLLVA